MASKGNPCGYTLLKGIKMKRTGKENPSGLEETARKKEVPQEFDVILSPDGVVMFSWNTPDIQSLAKLLGIPEFDPPRWCG